MTYRVPVGSAAGAVVACLMLAFAFGGRGAVADEPTALTRDTGRSSEKRAHPESLLERFPDADTDGDGVLSEAETQALVQKLRREQPKVQRGTGKVSLPDGAQHLKKQMVAMRDGVKIATDIMLPAGEGPWPVILFRTPYGRLASLQNNGLGYIQQGVAWVAQDFRGLFDSEGSFDRFSHEIDDGYDALAWISRQKWCNGRIGMTGGSGPGIGAKLALVSNHPNLVAVSVGAAASNLHQYCFYHGGVFRAQMNDMWFRQRGEEIPLWPKPRTQVFTAQDKARMLGADGAINKAALLDMAGWYDIFLESALDDFAALKDNPHRCLVIGPTAHGGLKGLTYPPTAGPDVDGKAWLLEWLNPTNGKAANGPQLVYFLMGDTVNPGAPGNVWKQTDTWPVSHTPTSFYLTPSGGLEPQAPEPPGTLTYGYDPRDPIPTVGGANLAMDCGPMDQRVLQDRKDILRFRSEPLTGPLEVTGKVLVELHIGSDVPDTTFMAKLIDIYPDGYEALMLDSAVMARYWNGFDKPAPLESGKIYKLTVDLWSTALVFAPGHRVGVQISSSNAPRYDVHPNSYEPVDSFDKSPVARNTIHLGGPHASRLILPVVRPGTSKDYQR